jgi:integrase
MSTDIVVTNQPTDLVVAGQVANQVASRHALEEYQLKKAHNTLDRQRNDLERFRLFLSVAGVIAGDLFSDPMAWQGITWGLVSAFVKWMLQQGDSIGSVNLRLSTIKVYAGLAARSGSISETDYAMIRTVKGYRHSEGKKVDEKRTEANQPTRRGAKKAQAISITKSQAKSLKNQPDTPQGRKDALLISLMLDLGLRVGEVAGVEVSGVNIDEGLITVYRPKVDKLQTHEMFDGLLDKMRAYMAQDAMPSGLLFRSAENNQQGMSRIKIYKRVASLGRAIGIEGLSPHDLRHHWATNKARNPKVKLDTLMHAGGWSSPAMPMRYIEANTVVNRGMEDEEDNE